MDKNYITNRTFGAVFPVLAVNASTTANVKTTNAIQYKVDGQTYSLAATANVLPAIPSTITIPAASTGSIGVYVDGGGVFSYKQGTTYLNTALVQTLPSGSTAAAVYTTLGLPAEVPGKSLIGYIIVNSTNTSVYTGGTSALNGTGGFVVTFIDNAGYVGL